MTFWHRFRQDLSTKGRDLFRFMIQNWLIGMAIVVVVVVIVLSGR
jgi:hypothetical protein